MLQSFASKLHRIACSIKYKMMKQTRDTGDQPLPRQRVLFARLLCNHRQPYTLRLVNELARGRTTSQSSVP